MLGKSLYAVLFVALQCSVVFCRSMDYQDSDENKESTRQVMHSNELSEESKRLSLLHSVYSRSHGVAIAESTESVMDNSELSEESKRLSLLHSVYSRSHGVPKPDMMSSDTYADRINIYNLVAIWTGIVLGIFSILSFILGCILYFLCRKPPRRGIILSSNRVQQPGQVQHPHPVTVQHYSQPKGNIQELPPTYQSTQQSPQQYQQVQQKSYSPAVPPEHRNEQQSATTIEFHNPISSTNTVPESAS